MKRNVFLLVFSLLAVLYSGCVSQNKNAEGVKYYGQARYSEAMTAFQAALQAKPNDPDTEYNIAATFHQSAKISLQAGQGPSAQQQYDQAAQYYRLCLSKNPNHTAAYRGLATLYMDCQNADAAFQLLISWYNSNPVSSEPKLELARLYQEFAQISMLQGRTEVAKECLDATQKMLQQVLAAEPANFRALRALGYLKEQSGDTAGAVADYQRSLQANSSQRDLEARITALSSGGK